jgi:hypothetical protein
MANKTYTQKKIKLANIVKRLTRKFSPDEIQAELGLAYETNSIVSTTEPELEFWLKCSKASFNLSSGMNKWGHEMWEEINEGDE